MTAFLLICFALPIALVWVLCWRELFGSIPLFEPKRDLPHAIFGTGAALLLSVFPVAVGWLACIVYRTGAEAWPFVVVTWTGILAGALVARGADARRVITAYKAIREHEEGVARKVQELGLGPQGRHDYEPFDFGNGGFRPELHALWWLRAHDSNLPKVTKIEAVGDNGEQLVCLEVDGVPTLSIRDGVPYIPDGCVPPFHVLPLLTSLLWVYDETVREHQKAEHIEREARKRKRKADEEIRERKAVS